MRYSRWLVLVLALILVLPTNLAAVAAEPSLDLAPWRGPCVAPVVASGSGFAPGQAVKLTVQPEDGGATAARALSTATVDATGNFTATVNFGTFYPGCAAGAYRVIARDAADALLAYAIYTIEVAPAQGPTLALDPATGSCATADPLVVAHGTAFPLGAAVLLDVRIGTGAPATFPAGVIATDGTFNAPIRLVGCGPTTPAGTTISVVATRPTRSWPPPPSPWPGLPATGCASPRPGIVCGAFPGPLARDRWPADQRIALIG